MNLREQVSIRDESNSMGRIEFRQLISVNRSLRDGRIRQRTGRRGADGRERIRISDRQLTRCAVTA